MDAATLKSKIRTVRDWPKPGINFRDVTTLFQDAGALQATVDALATAAAPLRADLVAAVDARGFIVGGVLAYKLGKPFVLVRKKGKLPFKTVTEDYALEYGTATLEIHADACRPGDRVFVIDDLIATGGTQRLTEAGLRVHTLCGFEENE